KSDPMKKIITLVFLFLSTISISQVQKLRDLSRGNFIGSNIVYTDDGTDVYGYFLLYQFNQKSRNVYDIEYILLDKNLNKITGGVFTEGVYKKFLGKTEIKPYFAKKIDNKLVFCIYDRAEMS